MKKNTLTLLLALGALALSNAWASPAMTTKHKGLTCTSCHQTVKGSTGMTPPDRKTCLSCHNEEAIIKAGEKFNFTTTFKDPKTGEVTMSTVEVNPHQNFHFGNTDQCVNCHKEHKPSTVTCETCHDTGPWNMKAPR